MTTYLLDTNVLSEGRKPQPHAGVAAWLDELETAQSVISATTVLEIERGILRLARRDELQARRLLRWFNRTILEGYRGRVLPIDVDVVRFVAPLHVPNPAPERDALIGGTALAYGLTVVTRNTKDFERFGVPTVNPWLAA